MRGVVPLKVEAKSQSKVCSRPPRALARACWRVLYFRTWPCRVFEGEKYAHELP